MASSTEAVAASQPKTGHHSVKPAANCASRL